MARAGGRVVFADLLRGPAALIVAVGHLVFLYRSEPALVAAFTMAPPAERAGLAWGPIGRLLIDSMGPFGVGLFFLISGFVIPMSLERYSSGRFLMARAVRIWPTYVVGLAIGLLAIATSAHVWGTPFRYDGVDIAANAALAGDLFGRPDILTLVWTLQIEVKFYLLAALLHPWLRRAPLPACLAVCAAATAAIAAVGLCGDTVEACWRDTSPLGAVAWEAMMIVFMLIGVIFFGVHMKRLRPGPAAVAIAVLAGAFVLQWRWSGFVSAFPRAPAAYLAALGVFALAFRHRVRIGHFGPTAALSAISYPLYVVHPLVGYVTLRFLEAAGAPWPAALAAAFALVFALAFAVHRLVEKPTMEAARRLADR